MARLRIVIEGEMSPEEMKQYIAAAWGCDVPRDVAISTVDLDEEPAAVEPPAETIVEPAAVVEPEPEPEPTLEPVVEAPAGERSMADRLNECSKTTQMIELLGGREAGLAHVLSVFREVQPHVPLLLRLGDQLEDRITRTFEGMK